MAKNRFDNLDPDRQEAILRAAGEEFAEKGFESASINRIILRSGMSKGSVYYYFEDKADLFATTLERSIQRMMDEIGWLSLEVLGPDEFWDSLLELTHRSVEFVRRDDWWIKLSRAFHRLQREGGSNPATQRLLEVGRGFSGGQRFSGFRGFRRGPPYGRYSRSCRRPASRCPQRQISGRR